MGIIGSKFKLKKSQRVLIASILTALSFLFKQSMGYQPLTIALMLATTVIAGYPILKNAVAALRYKIVGIDALVSIAVIGALFIGEYWEAAAVSFLFVFGDYLESRTIEKTRSSIKALLDLAPSTARVLRDGQEVEVAPEEVLQGDVVVVKPGEKISVDGTVLEGHAYINQSAITGESIPVGRGPGEGVFSGTVSESGYLLISADRVGDDTTFARILHIVEEAQDKKAVTQKFLEKFSRYYTPAIILLSLLMYFVTKDVVLALTLLVIACPGALVISTPVSIVAGIGNGAKNGILIKGGEIMEKLGTVKVVAFDKTGTLTVGKPAVTAVKAFTGSEAEVLKIAAIGESYSEHPLGRAIIQEAKALAMDILEPPTDVLIIPGQGLSFRLHQSLYYLGNRKLFEDNQIATDGIEDYLQTEETKGQTTVILGKGAKILGVISVADVLRPDSKRLVSELKAAGIKKVVMLTGDNQRAAQAIAAQIGLDEVYSELLPEDKVAVLGDLQTKYGRTAMVGDGVNDAPALASADLGIAMGGAGSNVAMETADVVLLSDEIKQLAYAVGLSRATVRNMKQNIIFAILVAALLLAGVLVKTVDLSFGMLVHEISVFLVIVNAVRLLYYGKNSKIGPSAV